MFVFTLKSYTNIYGKQLAPMVTEPDKSQELQVSQCRRVNGRSPVSEAWQRQAGDPGRGNDSSIDREGLRVQAKVKEAWGISNEWRKGPFMLSGIG